MAVGSVSFKSNYVIPLKQINTSEKLRQLGSDSAKYMTNAKQVDDNIIVSVNDKHDKEYEAVLAKYGLNIQKYEGKVDFPDDMLTKSYSFLVKTLHPEKADKMIEKFSKMDEEAKSIAYQEAYAEFKKSPYSVERQQRLASPNIKPTGTPIIRFEDKNGEKLMAREVILENQYICYAVASEKNPNEVMLINKDEFKVLMDNVKKL